MNAILLRVADSTPNTSGEKRALGIDIGRSSIKVVQLKVDKETNKVKLETYGDISLSFYGGQIAGKAVHVGEEKVLEAIAELFKEAKITTKRAAFSIDSSSTFVTTITTPRVTDKELVAVVPFEARKYLPVPVSEVELDYWLLPSGLMPEDDKSVKLVLAAVKQETLSMYSRYASRLGIDSPIFEIEGFSHVRTSFSPDTPFSLILDIGAQFTTVTLVHKGTILDMHVIARGSQDSTVQLTKALSLGEEEAEDLKREHGYLGSQTLPYMKEVMNLSTYPLFGDVGRLLLMYERKYNQIVEEVVLTGGGVRVPGIVSVCKETIRAKIRVASPFAKVDTPAFLHDLLERIGPSYSLALGLAIKALESK